MDDHQNRAVGGEASYASLQEPPDIGSREVVEAFLSQDQGRGIRAQPFGHIAPFETNIASSGGNSPLTRPTNCHP